MKHAFDVNAANERWSGVLTESFKASNDRVGWMSILAESKAIRQPETLMIFEDNGYPGALPGVQSGLIGDVSMPQPNGGGIQFTQTSTYRGSGDVPTQLFGVAMHVAQQTVGFDLLTVIPMSVPSAMHVFVEEHYAGGQIESGFESNPTYIQVYGGTINSGTYAATHAQGDYVYVVPATTGPDALAAGKALKGRFIKRHRYTGRLILKVEAVGDFVVSGTTFTATADNVADVIGTLNAVVPGTSSIANGTPAYLGAPVSFDLVSVNDDTVIEAANADGISQTPMTRGTSERGTRNSIGIRQWSTMIAAKDYEILCTIDLKQQRDMKAYGFDPVGAIVRAGKNQITQSINAHILREMFRLGVTSHANLKIAQSVNLNLFVGPSTTASKNLSAYPNIAEFKDSSGTDRKSLFTGIPNSVANSAAESMVTRQRMLSSRIMAASGVIANVCRYGPGNIAVVNTQLASALKDNSKFQPAAIDNTFMQAQSTLYYVGDLTGIRIYCDPSMQYGDTRVCVGRKGTEEDSGLKFFAYDLAGEYSTINDNTFAPQYLFTSSYELAACGFYPETNYLTFAVANDFGDWV